jgi:hypothetical protein
MARSDIRYEGEKIRAEARKGWEKAGKFSASENYQPIRQTLYRERFFSWRLTDLLAFPRSFGNDGAQLLTDLIAAALAALDFFRFPLFHAHNEGEFFTAFFADKFIGGHAVPPGFEE